MSRLNRSAKEHLYATIRAQTKRAQARRQRPSDAILQRRPEELLDLPASKTAPSIDGLNQVLAETLTFGTFTRNIIGKHPVPSSL
jgi:hypothetical protein